MPCKGSEIWRNQEKPYLCNVVVKPNIKLIKKRTKLGIKY